jgi:hypothetical protein
MKVLIIQFSPFTPPRCKYFLSTLLSKLSTCAIPLMWDTKFHAHPKQQNYSLYILIFTFLDSRREDKIILNCSSTCLTGGMSSLSVYNVNFPFLIANKWHSIGRTTMKRDMWRLKLTEQQTNEKQYSVLQTSCRTHWPCLLMLQMKWVFQHKAPSGC